MENNCVSVGDLTFIIGEDECVGLGSVSFNVMLNIDGLSSLKDFNGVFTPKDAKSADKILEAVKQHKKIEIKGRFRDTLNRDEELDWLLLKVLFRQIEKNSKPASFSFHTVASDFPLGTFTPKA
jgi:hypothetical protein